MPPTKLSNAITFGILALLAVAFAGYDLIETTPKSLGFIAGLGGGMVSIALDEANRAFEWKRVSVRVLSMVLSPLGLFVLFPFSLQLSVGYFIGSGITFCAGSVIQSLQTINKSTHDSDRPLEAPAADPKSHSSQQ